MRPLRSCGLVRVWFAQVTPGLIPIHRWLFSSRVLPQSTEAWETSLVVSEAERT